MTYEEAVREKQIRQKEQGIFADPVVPPILKAVMENHSFQQTFYIQHSYENKKFLGFNYKKKVGSQAIPVGLCEICNKLEIEHDA